MDVVKLQDECAKAARFRYKDDALASILGRLFLRQVVIPRNA